MPKPQQKLKPLQVIGELLITAGVIFGLFAIWQVYVSDELASNEQANIARDYGAVSNPTETPKNPLINPNKVKKEGDVFAKIFIPRFDAKWQRLVGQGTRWAVLNTVGVGHYPKTQMPGEVGNFAVAGHRGGFGGAFRNIDKLTDGDHIWIQTNEAWYVYKYLDTQIVLPTDVGVINPVPDFLEQAQEGGKYLTLTSCEPIWVNTHRIIAWFELESTLKAEWGMPSELKALRGE